MTVNEKLVKMQKTLENTTSGDFTNLASENTALFTTLKNNITNLLGVLNVADTWDDKISTTLNTEVKSGIDSMIEACNTPNEAVVTPAGGEVSSLSITLKVYVDNVKKYQEEKAKLDSLGGEPSRTKTVNDPDNPGKTKTIDNPAHAQWVTATNTCKENMKIYKTAAETAEKTAEAKIQLIQALLVPNGSHAAALATVAGNMNATTTVEELPNGQKKIITRITDENGKVIEESYQILDGNSNVVTTGIVIYNDDGSKVESYTSFSENGVTTIGNKTYNTEEQLTEHNFTVKNPDGTAKSVVEKYNPTTGTISESSYTMTNAAGETYRTGEYVYEAGVLKGEVYTETLPDGAERTGKIECTPEGVIKTDDYSVKKDGVEIRTGVETYNEAGKRVSDQYVEVKEDGKLTHGNITYNPETQAKVSEDYYVTDNQDLDTKLREGLITYDEEGNKISDDYKETLPDGSVKDGNIVYNTETGVGTDTYTLTGAEGSNVVSREGVQVYSADGKLTSDDYVETLSDGSIKDGNIVYDPETGVGTDNYTLTGAEGSDVVSREGVQTYNADGKLTSDDYVEKLSDGSTKDGNVTYNLETGESTDKYEVKAADGTLLKSGEQTFNADNKLINDKFDETMEDGSTKTMSISYNPDTGKKTEESYTITGENDEFIESKRLVYSEEGKLVQEIERELGENGLIRENDRTFYEGTDKVKSNSYTEYDGETVVRTGTEHYAEDGDLEKVEYQEQTEEGLRTGTINYDDDGNKETETYDVSLSDGTTKSGTITYHDAVEGQEPKIESESYTFKDANGNTCGSGSKQFNTAGQLTDESSTRTNIDGTTTTEKMTYNPENGSLTTKITGTSNPATQVSTTETLNYDSEGKVDSRTYFSVNTMTNERVNEEQDYVNGVIASSKYEKVDALGQITTGDQTYNESGVLIRDDYRYEDINGTVKDGDITYDLESGQAHDTYTLKTYNGQELRTGVETYDSEGHLIGDDYKAPQEDGTIKDGNITYVQGADGKPIPKTDEYSIIPKEGEAPTRTGVQTFGSDGKVSTDDYEEIQEDGTFKDGKIVYQENGKGEDEYVVKASNEEGAAVLRTGTQIYAKDGDIESDDYVETLEDGTRRDGFVKYGNDGKIDTDEYKILGEGDKTLREGTTYYDSDGDIKKDVYSEQTEDGLRSGTVNYDTDGNKESENYTVEMNDNTTKIGTIEYNDAVEGQEPTIAKEKYIFTDAKGTACGEGSKIFNTEGELTAEHSSRINLDGTRTTEDATYNPDTGKMLTQTKSVLNEATGLSTSENLTYDSDGKIDARTYFSVNTMTNERVNEEQDYVNGVIASSKYEKVDALGQTTTGDQTYNESGVLIRDDYRYEDINGTVKDGDITYDLESGQAHDTYTLKTYNGQEIRTGVETYDSEGRLVSDDYKAPQEDGTIKDGNITYVQGADGKPVPSTDEYSIIPKDGGEPTRIGVQTLDSEGNVTIDDYSETQEDGSFKDGKIVYNEDGTGTDEYVVKASNEEDAEVLRKGTQVYDKDGDLKSDDYEEKLPDGTTRDGFAKYDSKGRIDTDEYEIKDTEGNTTQTGKATYGNDGIIDKEEYTLLDEKGNTIRTADVKYNNEGIKVNETYTDTLEDGTTKIGTAKFDGTTGEIKSEEYRFYDEGSNLVGSGEKHFDEDGTLVSESSDRVSGPGMRCSENITYDPETGAVETSITREYDANSQITTKSEELIYDENGNIDTRNYMTQNPETGEYITENQDYENGKIISSNYEMKSQTGETKTGIQTYDTSGNLVGDDYEIRDQNGNVKDGNITYNLETGQSQDEYTLKTWDDKEVRTGVETYDSEGRLVSDDYKATQEDGTIKDGNITYVQGADGKPVPSTDEYSIIPKDGGEPTRIGVQTLDSEGNVTVDDYSETQEDGSFKDGRIVYNENGTGEDEYVVKASSEEGAPVLREGTQTYDEKGRLLNDDYKAIQEDGTVKDGNITYNVRTGKGEDEYVIKASNEEEAAVLRTGTQTYNKDGILVSDDYQETLEDGTIKDGYANYNDETGKIESERYNYYDENGTEVGNGYKDFDNSGNLTEEFSNRLTADGTALKETTEYDPTTGIPTEKTIVEHDPNDPTVQYKSESLEYDENGNLDAREYYELDRETGHSKEEIQDYENGVLIKSEYGLREQDGDLLKEGIQTYDTDGNVKSDDYIEYAEDGTKKDGNIIYNQETGEATDTYVVTDGRNQALRDGVQTYNSEGQLTGDDYVEYNKDGSVIDGNVTYDPDTGMKESDTYQVLATKDGEPLVKGVQTFNEEGKLVQDDYVQYSEDGTIKDGNVTYNPETGKMESDKYSVLTEEGGTPVRTGVQTFGENGRVIGDDYEEKLPDGTVKDGNITYDSNTGRPLTDEYSLLDEDGDATRKGTQTFDSAGRVDKDEYSQFDEEGKLTRTGTATYDNDGRMDKEEYSTFDEDGNKLRTATAKYNDSGIKVSEDYEDTLEDGTVKDGYATYDDKTGKIESEDYHYYDKEGREVGNGYKDFDENGNLTEEFSNRLTADGTALKETTEYDPTTGIPTEKTIIEQDPNNPGSPLKHETLKYEEDGQLDARQYYEVDQETGISKLENQDYTDGVLIKSEYGLREQDGDLLKEGIQTYDTDGNVTSDDYIEYAEDGTKKDGNIIYNQETGEATDTYVVTDGRNQALRDGVQTYNSEGQLTGDDYVEYNKDGSVIDGNVTYDPDTGMKESDTYQVLATKDGEPLVKGVQTFNEEGKLVQDDYVQYSEDGTIKDGNVTYNPETGKMESDKYSVLTEEGGTPVRTGVQTFGENGRVIGDDYEEKLPDGTVKDGNITYDSNTGRPLTDEYSLLDEDGDATRTGTQTFDSRGRIETDKYSLLDEEGNATRTGTATYDDAGRMDKEEYSTFDKEGNTLRTATTYYNDDEIKTSEEYAEPQADGTMKSGDIFYNKEGIPESEEYILKNGDDELGSGTITFNEEGEKVQDDAWYRTDGDLPVNKVSTYNPDTGNLTKVTTTEYEDIGRASKIETLQYDETGKIEGGTYESFDSETNQRTEGTYVYENGELEGATYKSYDGTEVLREGTQTFDDSGRIVGDDYKETLSDGTLKDGNITYDPETGQKVNDQYAILNEEGQEPTRTGIQTFDSEGKVVGDDYKETLSDGTVKDGNITYDSNTGRPLTDEYSLLDEEGEATRTGTQTFDSKGRIDTDKYSLLDEEGNATRTGVATYDDKGRIDTDQYSELDDNGRTTRTVTATYDNAGRMDKEEYSTFDEEGNTLRTATAKYNDSGIKVSEDYEDTLEDGTVKDGYATYDDKTGKIESERYNYYDENGTEVGNGYKDFDNSGNLTEEFSNRLTADGTALKETTEYDPTTGIPTEKTIVEHDPNDPTVQYKSESLEYDEKGNLDAREYYELDRETGHSKEEIQDYENGVLVKSEYGLREQDGDLLKEGIQTYDEQGNITGDDYVEYNENGTKKDGNIIYNPETGESKDTYVVKDGNKTLREGVQEYNEEGKLLTDAYTEKSANGVEEKGVVTYNPETGKMESEQFQTIRNGEVIGTGNNQYDENGNLTSEDYNSETISDAERDSLAKQYGSTVGKNDVIEVDGKYYFVEGKNLAGDFKYREIENPDAIAIAETMDESERRSFLMKNSDSGYFDENGNFQESTKTVTTDSAPDDMKLHLPNEYDPDEGVAMIEDGGSDGRTYSSKEAAIASTMATGMTEKEATRIVEQELKVGNLKIGDPTITLEDGGADGRTYSSEDAVVQKIMSVNKISEEQARQQAASAIASGAIKIEDQTEITSTETTTPTTTPTTTTDASTTPVESSSDAITFKNAVDLSNKVNAFIRENNGVLSDTGIQNATNSFIAQLAEDGTATYNGHTFEMQRNPDGGLMLVETTEK